jgi:hypothetical protein
MAIPRIPAAELREVQFQALVYADGARADSTTMTVEAAFPAPAASPSVWIPGEWVRSGRARLMVGPAGDVELTPGDYDVWARVDAQEEQRIGAVVVT